MLFPYGVTWVNGSNDFQVVHERPIQNLWQDGCPAIGIVATAGVWAVAISASISCSKSGFPAACGFQALTGKEWEAVQERAISNRTCWSCRFQTPDKIPLNLVVLKGHASPVRIPSDPMVVSGNRGWENHIQRFPRTGRACLY